MRLLKRKKRNRVSMTDISLTPLIDTALTLLIIFMVATPMLHNAIRITLPHGKAQEVNNVKQELVVEIDKKGTFFLNGKAMSMQEIIAELKKQVGPQQERVVFVKGDKDSPYGPIMELVDHIKVVGGVKHVALATQKRA